MSIQISFEEFKKLYKSAIISIQNVQLPNDQINHICAGFECNNFRFVFDIVITQCDKRIPKHEILKNILSRYENEEGESVSGKIGDVSRCVGVIKELKVCFMEITRIIELGKNPKMIPKEVIVKILEESLQNKMSMEDFVEFMKDY